LGIIILENKVQMDQEKLSGVLEWPVPTKVKQVQAFLGFANFYRRFIENFAKMSKLLSDLTKKDSTWTWGVDQQDSPWTSLLISGDGGCHRWTAVGVCSDTSEKV